MTLGSLFSGIDGFALAARNVGIKTVFQVENDPFCQLILKKNFPETKKYEDIREFNGAEYYGAIDILSGGFPCQPFSVAGRRKGTADHRWLWPQMFRVIREVRPRWIVAENVRGLLAQQQGMVYKRILLDLESIGYEVRGFIIPACSVGAPHKRYRLWIIAHSGSLGRTKLRSKSISRKENRKRLLRDLERFSVGRFAPDNESKFKRLHNTEPVKGQRKKSRESVSAGSIFTDSDGAGLEKRNITEFAKDERHTPRSNNAINADAHKLNGDSAGLNTGGLPQLEASKIRRNNFWESFPTQSPVCPRNDGFSSRLVRSRRNKAIRAAGNAIVPQVAERIFEAIIYAES